MFSISTYTLSLAIDNPTKNWGRNPHGMVRLDYNNEVQPNTNLL